MNVKDKNDMLRLAGLLKEEVDEITTNGPMPKAVSSMRKRILDAFLSAGFDDMPRFFDAVGMASMSSEDISDNDARNPKFIDRLDAKFRINLNKIPDDELLMVYNELAGLLKEDIETEALETEVLFTSAVTNADALEALNTITRMAVMVVKPKAKGFDRTPITEAELGRIVKILRHAIDTAYTKNEPKYEG